MNRDTKAYAGLDADEFGGMTPTGKIIREAWIFGLLPEGEGCAGWTPGQVEALWVGVSAEWEKYGFSVAALPDELRERFLRIQAEAAARARAAGWDPEGELGAD
jgi:hypothetical protein